MSQRLGLPPGVEYFPYAGFIVLERLKANTTLADIPMIVVSSQNPGEAASRALEAGAVLYLQKPVDQEQILPAVLAALPS